MKPSWCVLSGLLLVSEVHANEVKPVAPLLPDLTGIVAPKPLGDPGDWARLEGLAEGGFAAVPDKDVRWSVLVSFNGRIAGCSAQAERVDSLLELETCRQVTLNGEFDPARDKHGRAVMARFSGIKRWRALKINPRDPDSVPLVGRLTMSPPASQPTQKPRPFSSEPLRLTQQWVSSDDYPKASLRNGEQGKVVVQVHVSSDGNSEACGIIQSSNWPQLDQRSCVLALNRLHFAPALDARGQATDGLAIQTISWLLPDSEPAPPGL